MDVSILASLLGVYKSLLENTHNLTIETAKLNSNGDGKHVACVPEAFYPMEERRGQVATR